MDLYSYLKSGRLKIIGLNTRKEKGWRFLRGKSAMRRGQIVKREKKSS